MKIIVVYSFVLLARLKTPECPSTRVWKFRSTRLERLSTTVRVPSIHSPKLSRNPLGWESGIRWRSPCTVNPLVHINGILVTKYTDGDIVPPKDNDGNLDRGLRPITGFIGLQNHPPGKTVYFKEVSVHPISN